MSHKIDPHRLQLASYPFHLQIETQFSDLDAIGHVNNVVIARFYESARSRQLGDLFRNPRFFHDGRYIALVAEYTVRFLAEVNYPQPVDVGSSIARVGRSSFGIHQALFQDGTCVGLCNATLVLTSCGRPTPLPDDIRERMQAAMSAASA